MENHPFMCKKLECHVQHVHRLAWRLCSDGVLAGRGLFIGFVGCSLARLTQQKRLKLQIQSYNFWRQLDFKKVLANWRYVFVVRMKLSKWNLGLKSCPIIFNLKIQGTFCLELFKVHFKVELQYIRTRRIAETLRCLVWIVFYFSRNEKHFNQWKTGSPISCFLGFSSRCQDARPSYSSNVHAAPAVAKALAMTQVRLRRRRLRCLVDVDSGHNTWHISLQTQLRGPWCLLFFVCVLFV